MKRLTDREFIAYRQDAAFAAAEDSDTPISSRPRAERERVASSRVTRARVTLRDEQGALIGTYRRYRLWPRALDGYPAMAPVVPAEPLPDTPQALARPSTVFEDTFVGFIPRDEPVVENPADVGALKDEVHEARKVMLKARRRYNAIPFWAPESVEAGEAFDRAIVELEDAKEALEDATVRVQAEELQPELDLAEWTARDEIELEREKQRGEVTGTRRAAGLEGEVQWLDDTLVELREKWKLAPASERWKVERHAKALMERARMRRYVEALGADPDSPEIQTWRAKNKLSYAKAAERMRAASQHRFLLGEAQRSPVEAEREARAVGLAIA